MRKKYVYMIVTADKYELPIVCTESLNVIAKYLGITYTYAAWLFTPASRKKVSGRNLKFKFIKLDYDEVMKDD